LIIPETREPSWVKITSESPKLFPVVHHFPSILSNTPLVGLGSVLGVSLGELFGVGFVFAGVLVLGFGSFVILPPAGWARTEIRAAETIKSAAMKIRTHENCFGIDPKNLEFRI
jgi:hypothetical protein